MSDRVFNNNKTLDYAKKESINKLKEKIDKYSQTMGDDKEAIEEIKQSIENLNKQVSEIGEQSRTKIEEFREKITSYVSQLQTFQMKSDFQEKFDELEDVDTNEFITNNTDFLSNFIDNQMLPSDKHYEDLTESDKNYGSRHTQIIHYDVIDGWNNTELFTKRYGFKEFDEYVKSLNKKYIKIPITINLKTVEFGLVYRQKYSCSTVENEMVLERYFTGKIFFNNCEVMDGDTSKRFEVRGIIFNADNTDENDIEEIGPVIKFKAVKDGEYIYLFLDEITPYRFLPVLEKIDNSEEKKLKLIDIVQYHTRTGRLETILGPDSNDYYDRNHEKIELGEVIGINFEIKLSILDTTSYDTDKKLEVFDFVSIDETKIDKKDSREFIIQPAPIGLVQLIGFDYTQNESEDVVNKVAQVEKKYFKNFELVENPELKKPVHKRRPIQTNLLNWRKPQEYYVVDKTSYKDGKGEVITEKDFKMPPDNDLDGLPFGAPLIGSTYDLEDLDPVTGNGINFKNLRIVAETDKYFVGLVEADLLAFGNLPNSIARYAPWADSSSAPGPMLNLFGNYNSLFDSKYDNVSVGIPQVINSSLVNSYDVLDSNMGVMKKITRMFTEKGYEKLIITGKRKVLETTDLLEYKTYFDKNLLGLQSLMYPGVYSSYESLTEKNDENLESAYYTHTIAYDSKTNYLYYMKINEGSRLTNGVVYRKQVGHNINSIWKIFSNEELSYDHRFDSRSNQFNLWIDDMNNNNIFPNYQRGLIFTLLPISNDTWSNIQNQSIKRIGAEYYKLVNNQDYSRLNYYLFKNKSKYEDDVEYIGNGYLYGGFESDGRNSILSQGWDIRSNYNYDLLKDNENLKFVTGLKVSKPMIGYGKIGKALPYSAAFLPTPVKSENIPDDKMKGDYPYVLGIESDKKGGYGVKTAYSAPYNSNSNQFAVKYSSIYPNFDSSRGSGKFATVAYDNNNGFYNKFYTGLLPKDNESKKKITTNEFGSVATLIPPRVSQFSGVMDGVFLGFMNNMTRSYDTTVSRFFMNTGTSSPQNNVELYVAQNFKVTSDVNNFNALDPEFGAPFAVPNTYDKYSHLYVSLIAGRKLHVEEKMAKQYNYLELTTRKKNCYWKPLYWIYINKSNYQYYIRKNIHYLHNTGLQSDGEEISKSLFWALFRSNNILHSGSNDRFMDDSLTINPADFKFPSDSFTLLMTNKFSFEMINGPVVDKLTQAAQQQAAQQQAKVAEETSDDTTQDVDASQDTEVQQSEDTAAQTQETEKAAETTTTPTTIEGALNVQILDLEGNNKNNELMNILSSLLDNDNSIPTEFVAKIAANPENTSTLVLHSYPDWKKHFDETFEYKELKRTKLKVITDNDVDKLFIVGPCFIGYYARRTENNETHDGFVFPVVLPDKIYSNQGRVIKPNTESMYMIQYFTIIPNIFNSGSDLWFIETVNLGGLKKNENNISRTRISYRLAPTMFKHAKISDDEITKFPFMKTSSLLFDKWDGTARDSDWKVIEINRNVNQRYNPNFPNAAFILASYFDEKNKKLVCFLDSSRGLGDMGVDTIFKDINSDEEMFTEETGLQTRHGLNVSRDYAALVFDLVDLNNLTFEVSKSKDWIPWSMIDNDNIGYERFNMKYLIGEDSEGKYLIHPNKGIIYDISDYLNIKKRKNQRFPTTQVVYNNLRNSYVYLTNTSDAEYNDERKVFKGPAMSEVPCYDIDFKEKTLSEQIKEYLKERYDNNGGEDLMVEITVKMRAENLGLKDGSLERVPRFKFTEVGTYNPYSKSNKLVRYVDKITMFDDFYPRNPWIDDRRRWDYENIVDKKRLQDRYALDKRKDIELFFGGNVRADLRLSKMISQPLEGFDALDSMTTPAIAEVVVYPTKVNFKNVTYKISRTQGEDYDSKPDANKNNMVRGFIDNEEIYHNVVIDTSTDSSIDISSPNIWRLNSDISEFDFVDSYETTNGNVNQMAILSNKYISYSEGAKFEIYDVSTGRNRVFNIDLPITNLGPMIVTSKLFKDDEDLLVAAICSNEALEKGFLVYWKDRYYKLNIDNYLFDKGQEYTYKFDKNNNLWVVSKEGNKWYVTVYSLVYSDNNITANKLYKYELSDVPTTENVAKSVYLTLDDVTNVAFVVFTKLQRMYQIGFPLNSNEGEQRIITKDFSNTDGTDYYVFAQRNVEGFNYLRTDKLDVSHSSTIGTINPLKSKIFNSSVITNINLTYNEKIKSFTPTNAIVLRDNSILIVGKMIDENGTEIENKSLYLYDKSNGDNNASIYQLPLPGEDIAIDKIAYSLRNDKLLISTRDVNENKRIYILRVNYTMA